MDHPFYKGACWLDDTKNIKHMDKPEILKKAIEKALKNGWKDEQNFKELYIDDWDHWSYERIYDRILGTIFQHDFAKAFWGEELRDVNYNFFKSKDNILVSRFTNYLPSWKANLQMMVLEEDPISYLAKFI